MTLGPDWEWKGLFTRVVRSYSETKDLDYLCKVKTGYRYIGLKMMCEEPELGGERPSR